jgi:endonuclease YncB( thermonuclease family)
VTPAEFDAHLWHYNATLVRCIDGDTFEADVDLGFGVRKLIRVRALGYDAPELHGATAEAGARAKAFLQNMLDPRQPWNATGLRLVTEKDSQSFERYLARVYLIRDGQLRDLAAIMIAAGHGRPR